jgi:hypothetical protein
VCVRACVEEVGCQTWRDRRCNRRYGKCSGGGGGGGSWCGGTFTGSCVCARLKPAVPRCMCAVARVQRAGKRDNRTDTQKTHALPTNTPLQTPTRRKRDFSQVSARCPVPGEVNWDTPALLLHVETAKGPVNEGAESGALWCLQHTIKHAAW